MVNPSELRIGNQVLLKSNNRINRVACTFQHFAKMEGEGIKDFFPVVFKPELLEKIGFSENMKYPLRPDAREFRLLLPVMGPHTNEIVVYFKSNGEAFGRLIVNSATGSNNFYHLHQLQNIYFAITGQELAIPA
jgi:hypothetical protein